jgi:hypothetical protein
MAQNNHVPQAQAIPTILPPIPMPAVELLRHCPVPAAFGFRRIAERLDCFPVTNSTVRDKFMVNHHINLQRSMSCHPKVHRQPVPHLVESSRLSTWLWRYMNAGDVKNFRFYPNNETYMSVTDLKSTVMFFLRHLDEKTDLGTSTTIMFKYPGMSNIARPTYELEPDPVIYLDSNAGHISIMPCGSDIPFSCSILGDSFEYHLAAGLLVYFVWPPIERNLSLVRTYFDNSTSVNPLNVCEQLDGGMTMVQYPGQVIYLPPFCPTVVFATKTSAAAVYRYRRMDDLHVRLRHAGLLASQSLSIQNPFRGPATLEGQILPLKPELAALVSLFLWQPTSSVFSNIVKCLAAEWDEVKSPFRELVEQHASSLHMKSRIFEGTATAFWHVSMAFSHEKCLLCQQQAPLYYDSYREHFAVHHWLPNP